MTAPCVSRTPVRIAITAGPLRTGPPRPSWRWWAAASSRGPRRWAVAPRGSAARSGGRPRRCAAPPAAADADPEEPGTRSDDLGEIGDRGLLDSGFVELAAAFRAGRLADRDVDRRFADLLGRFAALEDPPAGLSPGSLGVLDAGPLRERRRLPLAAALEGLDLGLEREHQGDQGFAIQSGQVRSAHGDHRKSRMGPGQEGGESVTPNLYHRASGRSRKGSRRIDVTPFAATVPKRGLEPPRAC